ncbi:CaiB/BaiF CoA-transferase family protein [Variovorax sp. OV700]|uniref:CaiB/BaiF CoA transferase family protein n=1 Tax=Variovorax sp. OV700 TaxID=1882826 RepID=UPI00088FF203|nr:CoA transferase [Variovorax sp. OV700]SDH85661.1 Crotonobetainyl-CoA:carnitine CoA-transferase CaiB [Variovorax sp. OV700]
MQRVMNEGALHRFRVIDLSQVRAGPTCVKQLADFGADVIKVEAPAAAKRGELYVGARNGADMQNLHRNKRSMTLDLKSTGGREVLMRLVATADVVVENFRPDVKTRLGIGYQALRAINPRIILVSISGFGQDGPYQRRPGFDQIIQGMCGLMSTTGAPEGDPMRAGAAVVDVVAGLYAALGALTALLERESSGEGQWVRTSLLHAGIGLMDFQAARYLVDGTVAGRVGNDHPTSMPTSAYPTSDGFLNVGAGGDSMWRSLCRAIGRPDLADLPEFLSDPDRVRNREQLNELLRSVFRTRSTAAWIEALDAQDVPCGPIYSMGQVFADEQVRHCGISSPVSHPERGPINLISQVVDLARTPARIETTLEEKGGSNLSLLQELGFGPGEIEALIAEGAI